MLHLLHLQQDCSHFLSLPATAWLFDVMNILQHTTQLHSPCCSLLWGIHSYWLWSYLLCVAVTQELCFVIIVIVLFLKLSALTAFSIYFSSCTLFFFPINFPNAHRSWLILGTAYSLVANILIISKFLLSIVLFKGGSLRYKVPYPP